MAPSVYDPLPNGRATQHEGTHHLAINDTLIRRWLVLLALRTMALLYSPIGPCTPKTGRHIVKRGPFIQLTEAATLAFVASKTVVPVPRVHCTFV